MAMFRPVDTSGNVMQSIIPLLMQKKRDEAELSMKQKLLDREDMKLRAEAQERAQEFKRKADETKTKLLMEDYKMKYEARDKEGIAGPASGLESMGFPVGKREVEPRSYGMGLDPMAEESPRSRLEYLVKPEENKLATGMDQLIANLPNKTPEEKINLKKMLSEKNDTPSSLKKLIEERDALPQNDATRGIYDQAISKAITSKGMVVESDGKGGFVIKTNVDTNAPGGMQKGTKAKVEEKLIASTEGLSRISNIVKSFKPEFQEIPKKLGIAWSSLKSKMGANIPPEEKTKLEEFGVFKQDALENINLYIKEITGAQMSEKEANRLRQAQPDPGEGIFDGDDPVAFKAKLVNTYKKLQMSNIRYNFYIKQGIGEDALKQLVKNDDIISLERMEKVLDEKGDEYANELKKQDPNMSTADLFGQVKSRLAREFGMEP